MLEDLERQSAFILGREDDAVLHTSALGIPRGRPLPFEVSAESDTRLGTCLDDQTQPFLSVDTVKVGLTLDDNGRARGVICGLWLGLIVLNWWQVSGMPALRYK